MSVTATFLKSEVLLLETGEADEIDKLLDAYKLAKNKSMTDVDGTRKVIPY